MPRLVLKSDVAASPKLLWQAIKGFSAIGDWNPLVRKVESEGDTVGSTRRIELEGAGRFVERLEGLDDGERVYSYSIVDSPLPVRNCTVEVRVKDRGDGSATVEWASNFESEVPGELEAVKTFQRLYQNALDGLQDRFGIKR